MQAPAKKIRSKRGLGVPPEPKKRYQQSRQLQPQREKSGNAEGKNRGRGEPRLRAILCSQSGKRRLRRKRCKENVKKTLPRKMPGSGKEICIKTEMTMKLEEIRAFWSAILEDEEMKLSDRMKAAENLAKLLPAEPCDPGTPERVVVEYRCAP